MGGKSSIFKRCRGTISNKRLLEKDEEIIKESPHIDNERDSLENPSGYSYFSEKDLKILSSKYKTNIHSEIIPPSKWQTSEIIGQGTFGQVLFAANLDTGELMAIKQIPIMGFNLYSANEKIKGIEEEVEILSRLQHPNIVRYLGTHRDNKYFMIFMEYVAGGSISSLIHKYGRLNEGLIRVYARQILKGLRYLHYHKIIHRDIKGANVLVNNDGICKLADFGSAKRMIHCEESSNNKSLKGTPNWMAPEVITQTGHGRFADIWSFGCLLVEMATGKPPWYYKTNHIAVMRHVCGDKVTPELPEDLSEEGKNFIESCFKRNPCDRPNASELLKHVFLKKREPCIQIVSSELFISSGSNYSTSGQNSLRRKQKVYKDEEIKIHIHTPTPSLDELEGLDPAHGIKGPFHEILTAIKDNPAVENLEDEEIIALHRPSCNSDTCKE
jgi:serine/threonine protein kinase